MDNKKNGKRCYTLSCGVRIPKIGFGTYKAAEGGTSKIIAQAIEAGYRCFDTASFYKTEKYLADAVEKSGIERKDFFYISKLWKTDMGRKKTKAAFEKTLSALRTDYLDLYLIHWPLPFIPCPDWEKLDVETWSVMEELVAQGRIRAIGLSNFLPHHIENIVRNCNIMPAVNQIEFHPGYTQESTVRYCKRMGIRVLAWSPIGRTRMLNDPLIVSLSQKYRVSPAQICLRFAVQRGIIPVPKASSVERIKENLNLWSFKIDVQDMQRLESMPPAGWSGEHPDRERVYFT